MASIPAGACESRREPGDDPERRLNEVIAGYLEDIESGRRPDRSALLAAHPDLADELQSFFANRERMERITAPIRDRAPGGETAAVLPFPAVDRRPTDRPACGPAARVGYFGDYELVEVIAEGGMGVVFKARQVSLDRVLALKMIRAGRFATDDDLRRFRLEAEAAAHLDHPNIVPIYEVGEHEGHHYYSMKLVDGGNLATHAGRFFEDPGAAAGLIATIARAIHYAHQRGILHRDVKPANILLSVPPGEPPERGTPLVADFGLAKRFEGPPAAGLTRSGSILGSPGYMAPEQADGAREAITTAVDVHALGAILYELLAGRPPFHAETVLETLRRVREEEPERLRALNPRVDRDLETIVLRCLQKAPSGRYASAADLADDLNRWRAGRPIQARPVSIVERLIKWARRKRAIAALLLLGVVAASASAIAVGGLVAWSTESTRRHQAERQLLGNIERTAKMREDDFERTAKMREDDYFHRILGAEQALSHHDPVMAGDLLEKCPADLRGWEWRHLMRRLHSEIRIFQGHTGILCASDFRPESGVLRCAKDVLPGSLWSESPRTVSSRDVLSAGSISGRLHGPDGTAYGLAFDRSGTRLATAGHDGIVKVWNIVEGTMTHMIPAHRGWASGVAFSPDGERLATAGPDGIVRIWEIGPKGVDRARELKSLTGHDGPVFGVAFSSDGSRIASAGSDGTVRVWDPARSQAVAVLRGHEREVIGVAFRPDGRRIASGGADRHVRIWDLSTRKQVASFAADSTQRINAVAYSPDGSRLAVGSGGSRVSIWDAESPRLLFDYPGHSSPVLYVGFSPGGELLASASQDATIKLWDPDSEPGMRWFRIEPSKAPTVGDGRRSDPWPEKPVRWSAGPVLAPGGSGLAAGGSEAAVAAWAFDGGVRRLLRAGSGPMVAVAYSPDGVRLAAVGSDRTGRLWNLHRPDDPVKIADGREGFSSLAYRPDGGMLATGGGDPPEIIQRPDGKWFKPDDDNRAIRLWDPANGRPIRSLPGHTGPVHALAFSPAGDRLASAGADRVVRIWDPDSGRLVTSLEGHAGPVFALAYSPDGATLASAGFDRVIRIWDIASGRTIRTLEGHANWVLGLAYSPDGSRLASAGADQTVRLWHPARGREVLTLRAPQDRVHGVAFSPDGARLAAASADGQVRAWEAGAP